MSFTRKGLVQFLDGLMELVSEENKTEAFRVKEQFLSYFEKSYGFKREEETEIPYEDFILLGQTDMEKRFVDLDGQEQRARMNEDAALELEYAFDMEDAMDGGFGTGQAETSGNQTADNSGMPESDGLPEGFVIRVSGGNGKTQAVGKTGVHETPVPGETGDRGR